MALLPRTTRGRLAVLFAAAVVALTSGTMLALTRQDTSSSFDVATGFNVLRVDPGRRDPMPSFEVERLNDTGAATTVSDSYLRGHVSVVNFWGSWCGPCRLEQPHLNELAAEFEDEGVRFLGVNVRDTRANALAYLDEFDVAYPSVYNPDASLSGPFRVVQMPATYVIDAEGRIAAKVLGAVRTAQDLRVLIEQELRSA